MRLIDADALRDEMFVDWFDSDDWDFISHRIDDAPTVDAVERRRGRWEYVDYGGFGNWHCTVCRKICICNGDFDYCPNCGAEMGGESDD